MRIEQLTFLRFIAASIVVIFHYGTIGNGFMSGFLKSGAEMVTFFFVLSGFVIGIAYIDKAIKPKVFILKRLFRILPIYLLSVASVILIYVFLLDRDLDPIALYLNLLFLQAWIPPFPLSFNFPSWSLSVEMFFYVSFPFVVLFFRKYNRTNKFIYIFCLSVWSVTQIIVSYLINSDFYTGYPSTSHDLLFYSPMVHLGSFLLGVAGALFYIENKDKITNKVAPWLTIIVAVMIACTLNNKNEINDYLGIIVPFGSSSLSPMFVMFIILLSSCNNMITKAMEAPQLVLLGEASYCLYLFQYPAYKAYSHFVGGYLSIDTDLGFYAFFIALVLLSVLIHLIFEKPIVTSMHTKISNITKIRATY